jgi:hypothetical protein
MKYIITEEQYRFLTEEEEEQKILKLPGIEYFGSWETMQKFLEKRGNPPYSIDGDLYLEGTYIESLGNLVSVSGSLNLYDTQLKSLGELKSVGGYLDLQKTEIETLGNLVSVGGYLDLHGAKIESLGNLQSVGGYLDLDETPISKKYSEKVIKRMIHVGGNIFM